MRVLLAEPLHPEAEALLCQAAELLRAPEPSEEVLLRRVPQADALITRGRGRITRAVLEAGGRLRCVARAGSGLDNVDLAAATERGLPVLYAPNAVTQTTAEHALALILALTRSIPRWDRRVKEGQWEERSRAPLGLDLHGRTLGVVGLGRIGTRLAEMAQAIGMNVLYTSRSRTDERFSRVDWKALLARAEVVSVHVDLNPSTRGLFNEDAFSQMRPGAFLVNTSRGAVVDEAALIAALRSGRLGGYAADVMAEEPPPPDHPLFQFENVILTPHTAALTEGAYRRACVETASAVLAVLRGERPPRENVRNPEVFDGPAGAGGL